MEDLEPIFGEAKGEWSAPNSPPLRPFLFYAYPSGPSSLKIEATDFHSNTCEAIRSIEQLEDMRDMTGIGGSWSEFMDYIVACLKSNGVKLVLEGQPSQNAAYAKLIAKKANGMPLISFKLNKLGDVNAKEVMANISLKLYGTHNNLRHLFLTEQERCSELLKIISSEKEKKESIQKQLDSLLLNKRHKPQMMNEMANSSITQSPDKVAAHNHGQSKVPNRVVPAYRRTKVRGAILHDDAEDGEQ
ncbi:uncharacterized protein LOC124934048 [Impatiens glandulifera]|uniref:uncharacterized protein LOC124934048 n=1 Tax=Impatiens glandulifera TaxID=253017 RepID=UPI001FB0643A|nr:uncharacterized protein LOC124934048 [Impatiens glandulifera]